MFERLSPTRRNWLLALLGVGLLWFAWTVRWVLNPLIAAYFLAYVVHPMVMRLQRRGWTRRKAVNTIFITAAVIATLVSTGIGFQAVQYGREVQSKAWLRVQTAKLNAFIEDHDKSVRWTADALGMEFAGDEQIDVGGILEGLHEQWQQSLEPGTEDEAVPQPAKRAIASLWRLFGSVMALGSFIVLLPIYTYFLLFELERIHAFVRRYLPRRDRARMSMVGRKIGAVLSNFFRGRLLICLLKGVLISFGLGVLGVKYALLLGMGAGFMALVPFAGPLLSFLLAFVLALQQGELDLVGAAWRTGLVFAVAEVVEGYVLIPKILGESLGLHPVVVLLSVFVGGAAFGMFGVLIALPVAASLVILFREFVLPALARFADEDTPPPQPGKPAGA